ncbi:unnamed protein product [Caenorhabditis angaria]|uniref:Bifunctional lysine-specific demethylase and histidyl-hydroxylase n=1 Tax=Caenorhabditis angaria TaxID=860376 RepID=A0A9P1IB98_9PELO|nr:unnamed protein product [Caenorhabditis angaria]
MVRANRSKSEKHVVLTSPPVSARKSDRWSAIESGDYQSASQVHYKTPGTPHPKFDKAYKIQRLSDGFQVNRVLSNPTPSTNPKKNKRSSEQQVEQPAQPSKKKQKRLLEDTIILNDSPLRKSMAASKKSVNNLNITHTRPSQQVIELDDESDEDDIVRVNSNGSTYERTVVFDKDVEEGEELENEDEEEMEGLDSDEDDEEEDEEELEEEEIDESEMRIDPKDIANVCCENEHCHEGMDDASDEDEEEMEDEGESDVSEMDAESDEEAFIIRDKTVVIAANQKDKTKKKGKSMLTTILKSSKIDFDDFPFSDVDSTVTASKAFSFMISGCDVQTFFGQFYQQNALVISRKNANYYGNLFSTSRFVELIENKHLEYGTNINVAEYKNGVRTTLNGQGKVYAQIIKQHLNALRSVQLVNPQTFDDRIWYFCEVLQELFGCFVGANTYLTPAGSSGFAPHWDEIDAFLLQVEGRKYWRVWAPQNDSEELPLESSGNFNEEDMKKRKPVFEGWIESGDMLYIPRGFIHQAKTDENVHSLHVTISTGRRWSFTDLMEKVVPQAITSLSTVRSKLRRGLPIGLLDMGGVLDINYPLSEQYADQFQIVLDRHMSMLRNFIADQAMDSAVDMMGKEFMKQALPPRLTDEEKKYSVVGASEDILGDDLVEFNKNTKIRFVRRHTQRLVMESEEECFIAHRMTNSRLFEGRPEETVEFSFEAIGVYTHLYDAYPEWRTLDELFTSKDTEDVPRKTQLAAVQKLFQIGVLLVKN